MTSEPHQLRFMRFALEEAKRCEPTPTAFCVGCVLVPENATEEDQILSTGFSRELPGNTHAEANALIKARSIPASNLKEKFGQDNIDALFQTIDVYCTMEPCSIRASGLPPCTDALISAKVKRCFIGTSEPGDFVVCEGAHTLKSAGIEVIWVAGVETECLAVARRGHQTTG
jgi:pyrimidine deaminase RibD-like protein